MRRNYTTRDCCSDIVADKRTFESIPRRQVFNCTIKEIASTIIIIIIIITVNNYRIRWAVVLKMLNYIVMSLDNNLDCISLT